MKKYIKAAKTEGQRNEEMAKWSAEINDNLRRTFSILVTFENNITEDDKLLSDKVKECADLVYEAQELSAYVAKFYDQRLKAMKNDEDK